MVRKLTNLNFNKINEIHAPFIPEEIREGDRSRHATLLVQNKEYQITLWRYSPVGVEFIFSVDHGVEKGDAVEIRIKFTDELTIFKGILVHLGYDENSRRLSGVRIFSSRDTEKPLLDRRQKVRWTCADETLPTGTAANPLKYNDFILFKVVDISASGMHIVTSMRNKLLGVGQKLEASISLPFVGAIQATLSIKRIDVVRREDKEHLSLGVSVIGDDLVTSSLAEYLLNFGEGTSIRSLTKDGFKFRSATKWLDFTYVKTEEEYFEVLKLRLRAYALAGKVSSDISFHDMADEFDSRSRILVVKHEGRIVGSLRAMFHEQGNATDHGRYCTFPSSFPKENEFVEASRVCTDPEYRGSDILYELLSHLLLLTIKSGRKYVVGGGSGGLIDFYKKCGYQTTGVKYKNMALGGIEHQLVIMNCTEVALAKGIEAKAWSRLYSRVVEYMIQKEIIIPTAYERFKINLFRSAGELLRW